MRDMMGAAMGSNGSKTRLSGLSLFGRTSPWQVALLLAILYYVGARLGLLLSIGESGISVFWIPNAVTLAALLLAPQSWRPQLVLGSWLGDIAAEVPGSALADGLVFSIANQAQTLICAILLRRASIDPLGSPGRYLLFLLSYLGFAAPAGATLVILFMAFSQEASGLWVLWRSWWLGDGLYVMTVTPLILTLFHPPAMPVPGRRNEAILLVAAFLAACYVDFFLLFPTGKALSNATLPLLLWAALRFGVLGAAMAMSALTAAAGLSAMKLGADLQSDAIADQMLYLQVMLFGNAASAMILAIVGQGWDRAEKERGEALREARQAQQTAERANAAKSTFLAATSHDLRQPFQALRLFIDILDQKTTEPESRKIVEAAQLTLNGGESLLQTLLDLSTLESGAVSVERRAFPVSEILGPLATECAATARQKNIDLVMVNSSVVVDSDPVLLSRLLRNILHNAIKYTERGRILLGCRRVGNSLRIEVWDTGLGIPLDKQDRIFEEFYQVEGRDKAKGFGIGLAVVQRTAGLLGHRISLRSTPGRGSVFAVTVGCTTASPASAPAG